MSNINQLLAKALSTTSEDEAMACLRMARKKGGRLEDSSKPSEYNGHDAKYWYDKAYRWYHEAKKHEDGLTPVQQKHLWNMYKDECESVARLRGEKHNLEEEIRRLKSQPPEGTWKVPLIMIQFILIGMLLIQLSG